MEQYLLNVILSERIGLVKYFLMFFRLAKKISFVTSKENSLFCVKE